MYVVEVVGLWYVGCGSSRVMSGSSRVMHIMVYVG